MKINKMAMVVFIAVLIIGGVLAVYKLTAVTSRETPHPVDPSLEEVKKRGKLIVASDIPYGVMEKYDQSGKAEGIDVDIASEIAKKIGVELEFKDYDFEALFVAVKNGEVDMALSSITITPERAKEMLFSIPYFNGGQAILVPKTNQTIQLPADLKDKKIGVQKETTGVKEAEKYTSLITGYDAIGEKTTVLEDLKTGKTEAVIMDYIAAISLVKDHPDLSIAGEPFTQEYYGAITKLSNGTLMEKTNETLRDLKRSGRLQTIINKWI